MLVYLLVRLLPGSDQRLDVDQFGWVVAGVTGIAEFVLVVGYRLAESGQRQVSQRIGFHEAADLLHLVALACP